MTSHSFEHVFVRGYAKVLVEPPKDSPEPFPRFRGWLVTSPPQLVAEPLQRILPLLLRCVPLKLEPAVLAVDLADMRESEKIERAWLFTKRRTTLPRISAKSQHARLVLVQLESELSQPTPQRRVHGSCVSSIFEAHHKIVGVSHDVRFLPCVAPPPCVRPKIEHVVQVDVRQEGADDASLWRTPHRLLSKVPYYHACLQPLHQQPNQPLVANPMLDELLHPRMIDRVEEAPDVCVEHPVHSPLHYRRCDRVQRIVGASSWSKPVRESEELSFVDRLQDRAHGLLYEFVLQTRYA